MQMFRKNIIKAITTTSLLLLFSSLLFAVNSQKHYSYNDDTFQDVLNLCIIAGVTPPSSATPVTGEELLIALERIDRDKLSQKMQNEYDRLKNEIDGPTAVFSSGVFKVNVDPTVSIEAYLQSASDWWISSNDWTLPYRDRLKGIELPVEIGISDYFFGEAVPEISMLMTQPNLERNTSAMGFGHVFSYNWDLTGIGLQRSMPVVAGAVIGNEYLHFYIGRDRQSIGNGYTGNLIVGDNFVYQNMMKFAIHTRPFTYNLSMTIFDSQRRTEIAAYDPFSSTQLNNTTFNGKQQYRIVNNYQITLFDKATISLNFACLFDSNFDIRMLNPFQIMHNLFNYTTFNNNDYGNGAALEANNFFGLSFNYSFLPGWNMYLEIAVDQFQLPGEESSTATEPPNAIGGLLNFTNVTELDKGILKSHIEVAYTSPNLYLNEKYTDGNGNIAHNPSEEYEFYDWNQDLILGNSIWSANDLSYSGYTDGPDTFAIQIGSEYKSPNWSITGIVKYKMHGQQGIRWHENQDQTIHYSTSVWDLALTGVIEHSLILEARTSVEICDGVDMRIVLAHIERFNNRNNEGEHWQDTQCSVGFTLSPMDWF